MKNKLVNKKVINSIGIGALAFITSCTPVLAAGTEDINIPEQPDSMEEPKEEARPESKNAKVSEALEDAKGAIGDARDILPETSEIKDPADTSLEASAGSVDNLQSSVTELDKLNQAVQNAQEELDRATDDELGLIDSSAENISDAKDAVKAVTEATNEQNTSTAEENANVAEQAQSITYESSTEAQAAKEQAEANAVAAENTLARAEAADAEAQQKLELAETSLLFLTEQKENAAQAYNAAKQKAEEAWKKLQEITNGSASHTARNEAAEAVRLAEEELAKAGEAKKEADAAVAIAMKDCDDANSELQQAKARLESAKKAKEEAEAALIQKELALEDAKAQESLLAEAYTAAEQTVITLEGNLKTVQEDKESADQMAGKAKEEADLAAQKVKEETDLAVQKKTAADLAALAKEKAEGEAQKAQGDVDTATKELEKVQKEFDNAKDDILETLFEQAQQQREQTEAAFQAWKTNNNSNTWEAHIKEADALANILIQYTFRQNNNIESLDELTFDGWVSDKGDNNYVRVTYIKDGVQQTEYFDYDFDKDTGEIVVLKKSQVFKSDNMNDVELTVTFDKGEPVYKLGNEVIDASKVSGDQTNGYTATVNVTTETYTYSPGPAGLVKYILTAVTKGGVTKYYNDSGKLVDVQFDKDGNLSKIGSLPVYNPSYNNDKKISQETIVYKDTGTFSNKGESYLPIEEFNNGSDDYQTKTNALREAVAEASKAQVAAQATAQAKAQEAKVAAENMSNAEAEAKAAEEAARIAEAEYQLADIKAQNAKNLADEITKEVQSAITQLNVAIENKNKAKSEWDEAKGTTSSAQEGYNTAKGNVDAKKAELTSADTLKIEKENAVSDLRAILNTVLGNAQLATEKNNTAQAVHDKIFEAHKKVVEAIEALSNLTAQTLINEEAYFALVNTYEKALSDFESALTEKGASETNLTRIKNAAQRARAAADAVFAYNTNSGTGGGTGIGGGSGTGSGTEIGGSTGTGGTGITPGGAGAGTGVNVGTAGAGMMTPLVTGVGAGTTGTAGTAGGTAAAEENAGDTDGLRPITDEDVPLADLNTRERNNNLNADSSDELQNVTDEDVPLADVKVDQMKMSWWWWLLILVLGSTGTKMYIDHQRKRKNEENKR